MNKISLLISGLTIFALLAHAQNKTFGIGVTTSNPNAALHVESPTGNQGILIPRLTFTQITAMASVLGAADVGMLVFDTTNNNLVAWNGSAWGISIGGSSTGTVPAVFGTTTGTGSAGYFQNSNASNTSPALYGTTNGSGQAAAIRGDVTNSSNSGAAVLGSTNGTGVGLYGITTGSGAGIEGYTASGATAIFGQSDGTGFGVYGKNTSPSNALAGFFETTNATNTYPAVQARTAGAGSSFRAFQDIGLGPGMDIFMNVTSSTSPGLITNQKGLGDGIDINLQNTTSKALGLSVDQQGTGSAGSFTINNTGSGSSAIAATTNGTGSTVQISNTNASNPSDALSISTNGAGDAIYTISTGSAPSAGFNINNPSNSSPAVYGQTNGTGQGVAGWSNGTGSAGFFQITNVNNPSPGLYAETNSGINFSPAFLAKSIGTTNSAGGFYITDPTNTFSTVYSETAGSGPAGNFVTTGTGSAGYFNINNTSSNVAALVGTTNTNTAVGTGVNGYATGTAGQGGSFEINNTSNIYSALVGKTNGTGSVLFLNHVGTSGDIAVFQSASANAARIDKTGKGFFNGGAVTGGADLAEMFDVAGSRNDYEPGDVLVISESADRTVEKSSSANSTKVAGVYATKPGVTLMEKNIEENLDQLVPMGVIGVIPTKVCSENGPIKRGDLLVTSSMQGHAMKAIPVIINGISIYPTGAVLGKALENFDAAGTGLIKVLVNVK